MIMKKTLILLVLLVVTEFISAQNVTINGKTNVKNALVRLFTYNEVITNEVTLMSSTKSDSEGRFSLKTNINEVVVAQIAIDLQRVDIILKPSSEYEIEINVPKKDDEKSYFEQEKPSLTITKTSDGGLYRDYVAAQQIIDDYLYENFNTIYRGRNTKVLDTLDVRISKHLAKNHDKYIDEYISYRKASIINAIRKDGGKYVVAQYFDRKPMMTNVSSYGVLFEDIFSKYLKSNTFDVFELIKPSVLDYVCEKDEFLKRNREIAEAIVILNLKRIYYEGFGNGNSSYKDKIINYLSKTFPNQASSKKTKQLAKDVLVQLKRLSYDSAAPSFALSNGEKIIKLSDFNKELVVLQFVDGPNPVTNEQINQLAQLAAQWGNDVKIITIVTKDGFKPMQAFFKEKGIKWTLLNLGDDILLLEDYHVGMMPNYFIIKPEGKIGMAPAPAPEQNLFYHVARVRRSIK